MVYKLGCMVYKLDCSLLLLISIKVVALLNLRHQNSCMTSLLTVKLANYKLFSYRNRATVFALVALLNYTYQCILFNLQIYQS